MDKRKKEEQLVSFNLSEMRVPQRSFGLRVGDDDANPGEDLEKENCHGYGFSSQTQRGLMSKNH